MALGQLPDSEKDTITKHIEDCPRCEALYNNLAKVLNVTEQMRTTVFDEQLCDNAKDRLFTSIKSEQTAQPEHIDFGIWRTIMKNPLIKIAAAALIIFAVGLAISIWPKHQEDKPFVTETQNTTQKNVTSNKIKQEIKLATTEDNILQRQLKDAEAMFAAADTKGLIEMLKTGEYEAKVAAANYLAQLGDVSAIEPLETTAEQYAGTSQDQPFVDAAEQLKIIVSGSGQPTGDEQEPAAGASAKDTFVINEILQVLPAETLFCLKLNKLDYGLMQMDQYIDGVSPIPMAATMGIRMQLSQFLADPALTNVDTISDFAVFGVVKPGSEGDSPDDVAVAFLVPMKDYDKFVEENTNCSSADANGVSIISQANKKMNMLKLGNYGLICQAGGYQTLLDVAEILKAPGKSLSGTLSAAVMAGAQEKPLWAYTNIQQCEKVFGEFIKAKIQESKGAMDKENAKVALAPLPAEALDFYFGMLDILFTEMDYIAVSVEPTAEKLDIEVTSKAIDGTPMARMFSTNPNKKVNQLLPYLREGSIYNIAGNMNSPFCEELSLTSYDIMSFMSDDISEETMAKTQELVNKMVTSSGNGVMSINIADMNQVFADLNQVIFNVDDANGKTTVSTGLKFDKLLGIEVEYIVEMRDAQTWETVNDEIMQLWSKGGFAEAYSDSFGIDTAYNVEKNVETYRGVSIDSADFLLKPTDPNSEYGRLITGIYGDKLGYRSAVTDGLYLNVLGQKSEERMHTLIDKVKSLDKPQLNEEISKALALLNDAEKCDFFLTINYVRIFGFAGALASAAYVPTDESEQTRKIFDGSALVSKSNIVVGGTCDNGALNTQIVFPKEHLVELMEAIKAINPVGFEFDRPQTTN